MRCPICSAIVTGGGVCQNCGATLPSNVRAPQQAPRRKGGLLSGAIKPKRAGTLGDMFRSAAGARPSGANNVGREPPQLPQLPQRPSRDAQPPRQAPSRPQGTPPSRAQGARRRAQERESAFPLVTRTPSPPRPATPPSPSVDPWASSYGAAPFTAAPFAPSGPSTPSAPSPPSEFDDGVSAWEDDAGWDAANPPTPAPPYDLFDGAPDEWQQSAALFAQGARRAGAPRGMAVPPGTVRARSAVSKMSRLTLNAMMFGVVLLILAIAIIIGLRYVQSTQSEAAQSNQPTPTIVPTAAPPNGFSGFQTRLYSVSYPTQWQHKPAGDALGCACSISGDAFGDGTNTSIVIYTRPAAPADELAQLPAQAAASVASQQTPQVISVNLRKTYAGASWQENDYTISKVTGSTAVELQVRVLIVNYNATTFIIVASAPQTSFDHTNSAYFEPMLRTFRFS